MSDIATYLISLLSFDNKHPLLFTQFNFWAFLLVVYALFCLVASWRKWNATRRVLRNGYLFAVSLLFYYKTSGLFVLLLVLSTFLGYLLGWRMDALADRGTASGRRKALMTVGVVINLAVLCYFKYAYFFTDIYNTATHSNVQVVNFLAQWSNHFTTTARFDASVIVLPVGISFFTFQNISYIVDVYHRKVRHVSNVLDFGFYTSFFPQLVAGPIVRADQFVPQLYKPFFLSRRQFGIAVFWIMNGLFKKIILSDYLAVSFVDRVFDNPTLFTPFENFMALMVYSLQVYADFSGYTDIAIGVAMLMGFYLPLNFRSPYKATNPAGFWKRWHISLSNWLKDYLYIPLGGNRSAGWLSYFILAAVLAAFAVMAKSMVVTVTGIVLAVVLLAVYLLFPAHRREMGTNVNNMDTMLLGGLWHGASMNFVTWGGLNGLGILVYKWWKKLNPSQRLVMALFIGGAGLVLPRALPGPLSNMLGLAAVVTAVAVLLLNLVPVWRGDAYRSSGFKQGLTTVWNTALTFVFISFTRLFFRSGSNLNPAEANEVAWRTASQMVGQIGSRWQWGQVPDILWAYRNVFLLFVLGMAVHWLPERFKRRYRLWFASMPLWLMVPAVVLAVVLLYQFVTADLQPFIYFQF
ncbi:MAG: MBOAT family protein [Bacteroidales bacterium]|nr:MBOAT family protein [Bacteroidales bacterium]